jgi:aryl-alcohol dehydrogenase-like predicted oxidoreductase
MLIPCQNAETYASGQSEIEMGRVIKELGWDRRDIIVTTKVFFGTNRSEKQNTRGLSRKHIIEGCQASLERLQLDYGGSMRELISSRLVDLDWREADVP